MVRTAVHACLATVAVVSLATLHPLGGCWEGGANFHQQKPGNNDSGGVDLSGSFDTLGFAEIAVDPAGQYFLSASGGNLLHGDLSSGKSSVVPDVESPQRVAFGYKTSRFYVTTSAGTLSAVDAGTLSTVWRISTQGLGGAVRLYVSKDDQRIVAAGTDKLRLLAASTGSLVKELSPGTIVDVDFTPDGKTVLVTLEHSFKGESPVTKILVVASADGSTTSFEVPNCSSALKLTPDGTRAFIAPTGCNKDPISVIDVKARAWERNLPGFGPVDLPDSGHVAIAFLDATAIDASLFDDPADIPSASEARYHLMVVDTKTLALSTVALGESLPRYSITPDGQVVLVDSLDLGAADERIRVFDLETRTLETVSGPEVSLDHYVVGPSSADVYLLSDHDLYWLSVAKLSVSVLPTSFECASLNITPDGSRLLIMDLEGVLEIYDPQKGEVVLKITAPRKKI
jgi:DNA-binding beta-propeller fold protein YncE